MKNYADRGGQEEDVALVDNPILRDLHNVGITLHIASYPTQPHSVIALLFIQSISKLLTCSPPRRLSSKRWPISRYGFRIFRNRSRFYFAGNPQKVNNNHRAIYFAYSGISSIQFNSEIQLCRLRIAVNAIFVSSLLPRQPCFH